MWCERSQEPLWTASGTIRSSAFVVDEAELLAAGVGLGDSIAASLKTHGFVIVRMSAATRAVMQRCHEEMDAFWALDVAQKRRCAALETDALRYLGFRERPDMRKELFQYRIVPDAALRAEVFGSAAPLESTLRAGFDALQAIGHAMWACVGAWLGFSADRIAALTETSATEPTSRSNLFCLDYRGGEDQCPLHTDAGLFTVIPRARGDSGLRVLDWAEMKTVDVETNARDDCVVFGGELLNRVSSGVFLAAIHEVTGVSGGRRSFALQSIPPGSAVVSDREPETCGEFLSRYVEEYLSVNFKP